MLVTSAMNCLQAPHGAANSFMFVVTAIALNFLWPSDTALTIAVRSAQIAIG